MGAKGFTVTIINPNNSLLSYFQDHFTDEEAGSEKLSNMLKVTQLVKKGLELE